MINFDYLLDSKLEMEIILSELVKNFHAYSTKSYSLVFR